MRRFELSEGTSHKFWEIALDGTSFEVTFGRIGTNGQKQAKSFASASEALAEHDKLVKEKLKKGYAEVGGASPRVASAAPAPAPAPAAPAPAAPAPAPAAAKARPAPAPAPAPAPTPAKPAARPVTPGFAWTDAALREVAPRRGSDLVVPRKPDAKAAFAKLRAAFATAAPLLDLGRAVDPADQARVEAARKAFGADGPEPKPEVEAHAAAWGLLAGRIAYDDRDRQQDFLRYWCGAFGAVFAVRALARAGAFRPVSQGGQMRVEVLSVTSDPKSTASRPMYEVRDPEAFRILRHAYLLADEATRAEVEAVATELRPTFTRAHRALVTAALERADWAREELEDILANASQHHSAPPWAWPLVLCLPFAEVDALQARLAPSGWALVHGIHDIRYDLVGAFGAESRQLFFRAFEGGSHAATDQARRIAEALSVIVHEDVVRFFLANLATRELRATASTYLALHAEASIDPLLEAAVAKGPASESARTILRGIVAGHRAVAEAARARHDGARLALLESLLSDAVAREDAEPAELPLVLRDLPWQRKVTRPAPKIVAEVTPLAREERAVWKTEERERAALLWSAREPNARERDQALASIAKANKGLAKERLYAFAYLPDAEAVTALASAVFENFVPDRDVITLLAARHGLAALPAILRLAAMHLFDAVDALRRFDSPRVALPLAEAWVRLKKVRDVAGAWLVSHPETASVGLVPVAVGPLGTPRSHAEQGLRLLASRGHGEIVREVARRHGAEVLAAVETVLDHDPTVLLPKKLPIVPPIFAAGSLTRPLLAGRKKALPVASVEALLVMLAFTSAEEPYAGIVEVKAACDPRSLAELSWDLFQAWLTAGAPSKEGWAFTAMGLFGDDECARKLTPLVRAWPGEGGHARAVTGLDVLARIGTDVALMHLHGVAQKVKFKGLQERARAKIDEIAEARGLSAEELADRLVPDLGLEEDGTLALDFGPRSFKVVFDESLKPAVLDETGKRVADLPKPKQSDDEEKAAAATEIWKALKKDAKTVAQGQLLRLELAMCGQRRWTDEVFRTFLVAHPLLVHLVRRLVWGTYDKADRLVSTFRLAEDGTFASAEDAAYELPGGARVGLCHRLELGDALAASWGQVLADYEILQPFEQLVRSVAQASEEERAARRLDRVKGLVVPTGKVLGLDARGWRRGPAQDAGIVGWYEKHVQGGLVVSLELDPGIYTGMVSESPEQTLGSVTIDTDGGAAIWSRAERGTPMGDLPPVVFSELVRDLESLRST